MASYSIVLKPSVEKDLGRLSAVLVRRVIKGIEALTSEPFPSGAIKLTGAEQLHRIRVGDYRVIYQVDQEAERVIVHYVRHRREAYRNL